MKIAIQQGYYSVDRGGRELREFTDITNGEATGRLHKRVYDSDEAYSYRSEEHPDTQKMYDDEWITYTVEYDTVEDCVKSRGLSSDVVGRLVYHKIYEHVYTYTGRVVEGKRGYFIAIEREDNGRSNDKMALLTQKQVKRYEEMTGLTREALANRLAEATKVMHFGYYKNEVYIKLWVD